MRVRCQKAAYSRLRTPWIVCLENTHAASNGCGSYPLSPTPGSRGHCKHPSFPAYITLLRGRRVHGSSWLLMFCYRRISPFTKELFRGFLSRVISRPLSFHLWANITI